MNMLARGSAKEVWDAWFDRAKSAETLRVAQEAGCRLKKVTAVEWAGPCPSCNGDDRFSINTKKRIFNCRGCGAKGSNIDLVMLATGCSHIEATEKITGEPRPDRSRDETTEEELARLRVNQARGFALKQHQEDEARTEAQRARRSETAIADLFERSVEIEEGSPGWIYLTEGRGLTLSKKILGDLRFNPEVDYWGVRDNGTGAPAHLATLPAIVVPIRDFGGGRIGAHLTYLDPLDPTKKWTPTVNPRRNSPVKVRGEKKHGAIRLGRLGECVAMAEGYVNAVAWYKLGFGPEDVCLMAAVDLGNLAGKATGTIAHPFLKDADGRAIRIPNGKPDPNEPGVILPEGVKSVILLGDNDSEIFATTAKMMTAARRFKAQGLEVALTWPPTGLDFDDIAMGKLPKDVPPGLEDRAPPTSAYERQIAEFRHPDCGVIESLEQFEERTRFIFEPPYQSKFNALWLDELDEPQPEQAWLVVGWFTRGDCAVIGGPSQSGKSFLSLHLALHLALGRPFFGCDVHRCGVVYQAGEAQLGIPKRLRAFARHSGLTFTRDNAPFVLLRSPVNIYNEKERVADLIAEINAHAEQMSVPLGLVVIDTLQAATVGADEISGKDMGLVLDNVHRIARETKAAVILVHHLNAAGTKIRGHTSLYAAMDQVVLVTLDEVTRIRTVKLDKQKDEAEGLQIQFALDRVVLGEDQDGRQVSSCVCLNVGEREAVRRGEEAKGLRLTPEEELFMKAFFEAARRFGALVPPDWQLDPKVPVIVRYDDVKTAYDAVTPSDELPVREDEAEGEDDAGAKAKRGSAEERRREAVRKAIFRLRSGLVHQGVLGVKRADNGVYWAWHTGAPLRAFPDTQPKRDDDPEQIPF